MSDEWFLCLNANYVIIKQVHTVWRELDTSSLVTPAEIFGVKKIRFMTTEAKRNDPRFLARMGDGSVEIYTRTNHF